MWLFSFDSQGKSREQLEAEILPRFSQAVNLGLQVLEDSFITVEIKPSEGKLFHSFLLLNCLISISISISLLVLPLVSLPFRWKHNFAKCINAVFYTARTITSSRPLPSK